ncbi:MAG: SPASM domain-containing protein [Planctomycetes bacterium]|nr:SPASM domain-containing protein [Planctomycetota bacterium]
MRLEFHRAPREGETRDCTEPWTFVFLRSNGDVCLCCHTPPVGNVREQPLEQVLEGEAAHALRSGLLSGELAPACRTCPERGSTSLEVLRARVEQLVSGSDTEQLAELRRDNYALKETRAELLRERDALRQHANNLEAEREHLRAHITNLERELGR